MQIFFVLAIAFTLFSPPCEAEPAVAYSQPPYNVSKPPYAVTYSGDQIAAQVAAGKTLLAGLKTALAGGQPSYTIAPGVYRIPDESVYITRNNFTLDGSGATLILTGGKGSLGGAHDINDLTIKNLKIDADPPVWSQGIITSYDGATGAFQADIMPGYPTQIPPKVTITAYQPNGEYFTDFPAWRHSNETTVSGNTVRGILEKDKGKTNYYAVGNLIVFHSHGNPGTFHTWDIKGLTYRDVTSDMDCGFGDSHSTSGDTVISGLHGMRDPATNRLVSNLAFYASSQNGNVTYENCQFGGGQDDALDSGGNGFQGIASVNGNTMQVLSCSWQKPAFYMGDILNIYDHQHMGLRSSAKITNVVQITDESAVKGAIEAYKSLKIAQSTSSKVYTLTTDGPIKADAGDFVENTTHGMQETFTMNNCYWFNDANAVNAEGFKTGVFTNNTFEHINSGLSVGCAPWWWEGPFPQNITVTGNTFRSCGYDWNYRGAPASNSGGTALWIGPFWNGASLNTGTPATNKVVVTGNTFVDSVEYAVSVLDCNDCTIQNNMITNSTVGGIITVGSSNVTTSDNTVAGCHGAAITAQNCKNIAITGNKLIGPGDTTAIKVDGDTNLTVAGNVAKGFGNTGSSLVGGSSSTGLPANAAVRSEVP